MYQLQELPPLPNLLTRIERENLVNYLIDNWERSPERIWAIYGLQKTNVMQQGEESTQLEIEFNNPKP